MSLLCLVVGGAVAAALALPDGAFELRWTHSIEKVEWRESWLVRDGRLRPVEARIRGSGPGMEPPEGGRWQDGWWVYSPEVPPLASASLANSSHAADYALCVAGACRPLAPLAGGFDRPVTLRACGPGP